MFWYWIGFGVLAGLVPTLLSAALDREDAFVRGELLLLAWGLALTAWADAALRGSFLIGPQGGSARSAFTIAVVSIFVYAVLQVYRFIGGRPSRTHAFLVSFAFYVGALLSSAGCILYGAD